VASGNGRPPGKLELSRRSGTEFCPESGFIHLSPRFGLQEVAAALRGASGFQEKSLRIREFVDDGIGRVKSTPPARSSRPLVPAEATRASIAI
jgi:hypothetical protein